MSLLEPGSARAHGVADDAALVAAMVRVELAWYDVLVAQGVASADQAALVAGAVARWQPDVEALSGRRRGRRQPRRPVRGGAAARDRRRGRGSASPSWADEPGRARHRPDAARAGCARASRRRPDGGGRSSGPAGCGASRDRDGRSDAGPARGTGHLRSGVCTVADRGPGRPRRCERDRRPAFRCSAEAPPAPCPWPPRCCRTPGPPRRRRRLRSTWWRPPSRGTPGGDR